jgi:hypothetical protein
MQIFENVEAAEFCAQVLSSTNYGAPVETTYKKAPPVRFLGYCHNWEIK